MADRGMRKTGPVLIVAVAAWLSTSVMAGTAFAAAAHGSRNAPPGNNGTIKIDTAVFSGNRNHPHVGCEFFVNFFGYDGGTQQATLSFEPWAPTRGGVVAERETSWSVPARTAGNQLDHRYGPVNLSAALAGITPHPRQGFHVKLTVHVTGSQGADVKHKVFWIEPCVERAAQPRPTPQSPPSPPSRKHRSPTPTSLSTTPTANVPLATAAAPSSPVATFPAPATAVSPLASSTRVLGEQISPGQSLARTGMTVIGFLIAAGLSIAAGVATVRRVGRRTTAR
jgi:hypothetical protein